VLQLAGDIGVKRRNYQAARHRLEQKTAEAEAAHLSLEQEFAWLH